jgi:Lrp/AsnC family leucine-responsive transcriptional regulator
MPAQLPDPGRTKLRRPAPAGPAPDLPGRRAGRVRPGASPAQVAGHPSRHRQFPARRNATGPGKPGSFIAVEEIERSILTALSADGRLSYTDLAERVGLSVSAVHQRVRRLEQRGVIKGYAARVDNEAIGLPLTAFVAIRPIDPAAPDDAPERLAGLPEIESCYSVAGDDFYLLLVRVKSPGDLERLLQEIRTAASVATRTTVVLSTPYENRPARI